MLWSNQVLFAIIWDLFKDDQRSKWLLPTYLEGEAPESMVSFARKPIYAREGCDVTLMEDGEVIDELSTGYYGEEGYVAQELAVLPESEDEMGVSHYPVIGLWFVDGEPAGMATRESNKLITTNSSKSIPHSISDGPLNYERTGIPTADEVEDSPRCNAYMDHWAKKETRTSSISSNASPSRV